MTSRRRSTAIPGQRLGYMLVELLFVATALGALSMSGILLITLLLKAQSTAGDAVADAQRIARFREQFRDDVHRARAAEIREPMAPEETAELRLTLAEDASVTYRADGDQLVRETVGGPAAAVDACKLGPGGAQFAIDPEAGIVGITFDAEHDVDSRPAAAPVRPGRVEAALGWQGRTAPARQEPQP